MKLMIVEDEKLIREQLAKGIPWSEYGLMVAGTAANGEEALSILEKTCPDIVLTDIRMPKMDGLALLEQILREKPSTLVVMLTAYDDFDYVQQALRRGAFDFVLKIAPTRELIQTVLRAREKIEERERQLRGIRREQALLSREEEPVPPGVEATIRRVKRYMLENCGLELSLTSVAEAVGLNASYLSALFKSETKVGFSEYALKVRMEKAKELLDEAGSRVRDVARLVGYQDEKYFASLFKRAFGVTPSQYKKLG
jgi:YesN/AraC family two-component response regulator